MDSVPGPGRFHMLQATKTMRHNCWAHTPQQAKPQQWETHALQLESGPAQRN